MATIGPIGYARGLNTKATLSTIAKEQMSAAQNVQVVYGNLQKIKGSAAIGGSALNSGATIIGLVDWYNGTNRYFIAIAGSKIYQTQNLGPTFTEITGAATITAGNNNQHTFASLNNILAICGGTTPDTPLQWTGSGNVASLGGSPPIGNLVTVANNYMFISGVAATPSRVFWSNVSDPNTWAAASNIDFRASDGDSITAIAPLNFNLVIFKRRSTGLLYTQSSSTSGATTLAPLTQINLGIGCAGSQAWDTLPDGRLVVFGIDAHLRIFDGSNYSDISDPPPPASNIQPTLDALNIGRIPYACVKVYPIRNQIWLAVSTGSNTTNDSIYIYDYSLNAWQCQVPDRAANVLATSIDNRGAPKHPILILSGNYAGNVYEHDTGNTNPENSDTHIDGYGTVVVALGVGPSDFNVRSIRIAREAQTLGQLQLAWGFNSLTDVSYTKIISESQRGFLLDQTFILDVSTLAGPSTVISGIAISASQARNYYMTVQFRNQYASQDFTVHPFELSEEVIA